MGRLLRHLAREAFDAALFGALVALLLGPGQAWAQSALPGSRGGQVYQPSSWTTAHSLGGLVQARGSSLVFAASFSSAGAFASGLLSDTFQPITVVRASNATYCVNGVRSTATNNQARVESFGGVVRGLLDEPAATNYFLNSGAPVTQAISLPVGTYTLWMEGTGSVATAVGTATASGLPCTASSGVVCGSRGTICNFTVTVTGTVTTTVAGSPTAVQLEGLGYASSYIPTGGTAANRIADRISAVFPFGLGATSMCAQMDVNLEGANANGFNIFLEPYVDGSNVWFLGAETTPKARLNGFFAGTSHLALSAGSVPVGSAAHLIYRYDGINETACINGTCTSTPFSFSASTTFNGVLIGDDFGAPGLYEIAGNIKNIKLYPNAGICQ